MKFLLYLRTSSIPALFKFTIAPMVLFLSSCVTNHHKNESRVIIPYPKPLAEDVVHTFLPDIVSSDSIDFGAAFSPDGKSFYFSRTENKRSGIYVTHYNGTKWKEPIPAPFADRAYAEADPAFSLEGTLYFISTRPKDLTDTLIDFDIWFVAPLADGSWSEPQNMEAINSDSAEYYISFSQKGNLYFSSSRSGGFGEEDLYVSKWVNGQYTAPENLGPLINTKFSEYDPSISPWEDFIIFTSLGRDDGYGKADLYFSEINESKKWGPAINLGKGFNTPTREYCPYFTPDGKYFFFSSMGDVRWVSTTFLKEKKYIKS